jgi:hypothetical protein
MLSRTRSARALFILGVVRKVLIAAQLSTGAVASRERIPPKQR